MHKENKIELEMIKSENDDDNEDSNNEDTTTDKEDRVKTEISGGEIIVDDQQNRLSITSDKSIIGTGEQSIKIEQCDQSIPNLIDQLDWSTSYAQEYKKIFDDSAAMSTIDDSLIRKLGQLLEIMLTKPVIMCRLV